MKDMLQRLYDEHGRARRELEELLNKTFDAETREQRDFTSEERERFEKINADLQSLEDRMKTLADRVEGEKAADEMRAKVEGILRPNVQEERLSMSDSLDKRMADFVAGKTPKADNGKQYIDIPLRGLDIERYTDRNDPRFGKPTGRVFESRSGITTATSGQDGGATVPVSFRAVLYQHLIQNSAIRQTRATVITTDSGENLLLPKTTAHPASGTIVAEAAAIGESDPTFGQGTLSAYKYANLVQVSTELETDTGVDLLGYLAMAMGRALANGSGSDFVKGSGSSAPQGVIVGSGTVAQVVGGTGQSGIPTYKELESVFDKPIIPYQQNGEWMFSQTTLSKLRQIVDSNGRPLFYSGLEGFAGAPPTTIFGKPFVVDPNVPNAAVNGTSILFGDFSPYFIRDVNGLRFERSVDYAFNTDLVTYRAILRTDGRLLDLTGAIANYVGGTA